MKKLILPLVSVLALSACGSDSTPTTTPSNDDAADQIEEAIENQTGQDIDIDIDEITGDTVIEFESEGGDGSLTVGGGIPDGWPIPIPSGGDVQSNLAVSDGGVSSGMVTVEYASERFEELVSLYKEFFSHYPDTSEYSQADSFMIMSGSAGFTVSVDRSGDTTELVTMVSTGG